MTFYQYKDGYRYNSDTIFLYNFISGFKLKGRVLDVGSGCGVLGLLLKRDFPSISLYQIDVQKRNIGIAQKNSDVNSCKTHLCHGDFLTYDFEERFDFIVSNPPFYNSGALKSEDESLYLSRHCDALPFFDFAKKVYKLLKPRGSFMFCYDAKQIDLVIPVLLESKFKINEIQFVHPQKVKEATLVLIHAKRESKSLNRVLPPVILFNSDNEYLDEVKKIFKKADTNSVDY